jgi:antitoxin component of MazEF toxin-antitoxin module
MKSQGNTLVKDNDSTLEFTTTILPDGSLNIPKELQEMLGLEAGSRVHVRLSKDELSPQERGRRVQEMVQAYMKENNIPPATETGAERIRKMRDEDTAIEAKRGR